MHKLGVINSRILLMFLIRQVKLDVLIEDRSKNLEGLTLERGHLP